MVKRNSETSSLLSSRLNRVNVPSQKVDINGMKHSTSDTSSGVPTYSAPTYRRKEAPRAQSPLREKVEKARRPFVVNIPEPEAEPETAEEFDELIDKESYRVLKRQERAEGLKVKVSKVATASIVLLCLYFSFLIFGLTQTNYIYNDSGEVVPEVLSVNDLKTLDQYETLSSYYLRVRILYEKVLGIDYRLAQESEDTTLLAMEYTALLDEVSKLSTDLSAAQLDTAYTPILTQLYNLASTHIAVYLQNVAGALTNNDEEKASQAVQGRVVIENEFTTLTANMAQLCNATNGAKNGDIYAWSPDGYMESLAEGGES